MPTRGKAGTSSRTRSAQGKKSTGADGAARRSARREPRDLRQAEQKALEWSVVPGRPWGENVTAKELSTAMGLAQRLDRPVRIPPERRLETGLADYAMWRRIIAGTPSRPPSGDTRAGRIWA